VWIYACLLEYIKFADQITFIVVSSPSLPPASYYRCTTSRLAVLPSLTLPSVWPVSWVVLPSSLLGCGVRRRQTILRKARLTDHMVHKTLLTAICLARPVSTVLPYNVLAPSSLSLNFGSNVTVGVFPIGVPLDQCRPPYRICPILTPASMFSFLLLRQFLDGLRYLSSSCLRY
jgi:hypothetical protein